MKFSVSQRLLKVELAKVAPIINSRDDATIYHNVLIRADQEGKWVSFSAYNSEMNAAITCWLVDADVTESGEAAVPCKTLDELVSLFPPEIVHFRVDKQKLVIECGDSESEISTISVDQFQTTPEFQPHIVVGSSILEQMINQTSFCTPEFRDVSKSHLQGLRFCVEGQYLYIAALSGERFAQSRSMIDLVNGDLLPEKDGKPYTASVLPTKSVMAVKRILSSGDAAEIALPVKPDDLMILRVGNTVFSSPVIPDHFPNLSSVVPEKPLTSVAFHVKTLTSAARKTEVFAKDDAYRVSMSIPKAEGAGEQKKVLLVGKSRKMGEGKASVDALISGESVTIKFNVAWLNQGLAKIQNNHVVFQLTGAAGAIVIRPLAMINGQWNIDPSYIYVIAPIKPSEFDASDNKGH